MAQSFARRVAVCFLPFAAGYFLSYLFRSVNAVVGPAIADEFHLDAAALGALTSAYFAAFTVSQIPLGIGLDRYGPRRVQAVLMCSAVAGSLIFAVAGTAAQLTLGRALIGLGVSGCLMAAFSANLAFWPRERLPVANGLLLACGGLGATFATLPAQWLMSAVGWRPLFLVLAAASAAVVACLWRLAPDPPPRPDPREDWRLQLRGVASVLGSAVFWRMAPMSVATQGVFLAYQGLWAGPWLRDVAGYSPDAVATVLFVTSAVMILGFASTGAVFHALTRRGVPAATVIAAMAALYVLVQVPLALGAVSLADLLWPIFGFIGTGSVALTFTWLTQRFPANLSGRVNTTLNLLVFLAAFCVQAGVGLIIDWSAAPAVLGAATAFGTGGYAWAFTLMIALECAGLAWFVWPRPGQG